MGGWRALLVWGCLLAVCVALQITDEHLGVIEDTEHLKAGKDVLAGIEIAHMSDDFSLLDDEDPMNPAPFDPVTHRHLLGEGLGFEKPGTEVPFDLGEAVEGERIHDLGDGLKITKRQALKAATYFADALKDFYHNMEEAHEQTSHHTSESIVREFNDMFDARMKDDPEHTAREAKVVATLADREKHRKVLAEQAAAFDEGLAQLDTMKRQYVASKARRLLSKSMRAHGINDKELPQVSELDQPMHSSPKVALKKTKSKQKKRQMGQPKQVRHQGAMFKDIGEGLQTLSKVASKMAARVKLASKVRNQVKVQGQVAVAAGHLKIKLVSKQKECGGNEEEKGPSKDAKECGNKCMGVSKYFTFGSASSSSWKLGRCNVITKTCQCRCQVPGSDKCDQKEHHAYDLYEILPPPPPPPPPPPGVPPPPPVPADNVKFMRKKAGAECNGNEIEIGYLLSPKICADACSPYSQMFIWGTPTTSFFKTGRCDIDGLCKCLCEIPGKPVKDCKVSSHHALDLYTLTQKNGKLFPGSLIKRPDGMAHRAVSRPEDEVVLESVRRGGDCKGDEAYQGYVQNVEDCARLCRMTGSVYFVHGTKSNDALQPVGRCQIDGACQCRCKSPPSTKSGANGGHKNCEAEDHHAYNLYKIKPPVNKKQCQKEGRRSASELPWCEDIPKKVEDGCCITKMGKCSVKGSKSKGSTKGISTVKNFEVQKKIQPLRSGSAVTKVKFQVCSKESSALDRHPMPQPGAWKKCADGGERCTCPNGRVRIGLKGISADQMRQTKKFSDEFVSGDPGYMECKPENFMNGDPAPGQPKECLCTTCEGPAGSVPYISAVKCMFYVRDPSDPRYFDASSEWGITAIKEEFAPIAEGGTAGNRASTNCADWIGDMSKCGWYHKLFRSLLWPQGKIFPCFSVAYMLANGITETNGNNCAAMLLNGILEKHTKGSKNFGPEATKFMKSMRHLDIDIITNVATIVLYYAMEQCTERYKAMRMIINLTMYFGELISKILPAPMNTVGKVVITAMKFIQKLLIPVNAAVDGFYELRMKIFEPIDTLAHIMSDVTAFADIILKIGSMNKYTKMFIETVLKKSYINVVFATLTKFTMVAIKFVFDNPVVKTIGQLPMKACAAAMYVLTQNVVYKFMVKAGKQLLAAMSRKFTIMGKSFSVQWILRKLTAMMDLVIGKIMALLDPIIKPLKELFNNKIKPLFMALLKKFGFPVEKLPGAKSPGFMSKDATLGPGCYMRVYEPCVKEHKWEPRTWNKVTGGKTAEKCVVEKKKEWQGLCKVKKIVAKFVSGTPDKDPPANPLFMYHTCAFNIEYFMKSGMNRCECCIMGMMNPKKPVVSLLLYALKSKLCKLMRPAVPQQTGGTRGKKGTIFELSQVKADPPPQTCWSPTASDRAKAEMAALAKLDAASTVETPEDKKELGKEELPLKQVITPELKKEEKTAEKKLAATKGVPKSLQLSPEEIKEAEKEEEDPLVGSATKCAEEGEKCKCSGTVVYGRKFGTGNEENTLDTLKKFAFVEKQVTPSIMCTNKEMIENPHPDVAKVCMCIDETSGEAERAKAAEERNAVKTLQKANVDVSQVEDKDGPGKETRNSRGRPQKDPTLPVDANGNKLAIKPGSKVEQNLFVVHYSRGEKAGRDFCKKKGKGQRSAESVLDSAVELLGSSREVKNDVVRDAFVHGFKDAAEACGSRMEFYIS